MKSNHYDDAVNEILKSRTVKGIFQLILVVFIVVCCAMPVLLLCLSLLGILPAIGDLMRLL